MHKDKKSDPYMSNSAKWPSKRISHGMLFLSHLPLCHLVLFFITASAGMILMFIFGAKLDKTDGQKALDQAMHESRGTVMLFAGNYTCVIGKKRRIQVIPNPPFFIDDPPN